MANEGNKLETVFTADTPIIIQASTLTEFNRLLAIEKDKARVNGYQIGIIYHFSAQITPTTSASVISTVVPA